MSKNAENIDLTSVLGIEDPATINPVTDTGSPVSSTAAASYSDDLVDSDIDDVTPIPRKRKTGYFEDDGDESDSK